MSCIFNISRAKILFASFSVSTFPITNKCPRFFFIPRAEIFRFFIGIHLPDNEKRPEGILHPGRGKRRLFVSFLGIQPTDRVGRGDPLINIILDKWLPIPHHLSSIHPHAIDHHSIYGKKILD